MGLLYRNNDFTRWGLGIGRRLTSLEVDLNFWFLLSLITSIQEHQLEGVGIADISVSGTQMTITLTDGTTRGPFLLPQATWNRRTDNSGNWAPLTIYAANDIFAYNGSLYITLLFHTSGATFDPNATDGMGHELYGLLLTAPGDVLPLAGIAGQVLAKRTSADLDVMWKWMRVEDLHDVAIGSPLDDDDYLGYDTSTGFWINKKFVLPTPASGIRGGVELFDPVPNQFVTGLGADGALITAQPAFTDISGTASPAQVRQSTMTPLSTTSPASLDPSLGDVFTLTPTNNETINAVSAPAGALITLEVVTSGTTSFTLTFGTNFKTTGNLATGAVSGKTFTITFRGDGTNLVELCRTTAM